VSKEKHLCFKGVGRVGEGGGQSVCPHDEIFAYVNIWLHQNCFAPGPSCLVFFFLSYSYFLETFVYFCFDMQSHH
jgi:hypothetical protein